MHSFRCPGPTGSLFAPLTRNSLGLVIPRSVATRNLLLPVKRKSRFLAALGMTGYKDFHTHYSVEGPCEAHNKTAPSISEGDCNVRWPASGLSSWASRSGPKPSLIIYQLDRSRTVRFRPLRSRRVKRVGELSESMGQLRRGATTAIINVEWPSSEIKRSTS